MHPIMWTSLRGQDPIEKDFIGFDHRTFWVHCSLIHANYIHLPRASSTRGGLWAFARWVNRLMSWGWWKLQLQWLQAGCPQLLMISRILLGKTKGIKKASDAFQKLQGQRELLLNLVVIFFEEWGWNQSDFWTWPMTQQTTRALDQRNLASFCRWKQGLHAKYPDGSQLQQRGLCQVLD